MLQMSKFSIRQISYQFPLWDFVLKAFLGLALLTLADGHLILLRLVLDLQHIGLELGGTKPLTLHWGILSTTHLHFISHFGGGWTVSVPGTATFNQIRRLNPVQTVYTIEYPI